MSFQGMNFRDRIAWALQWVLFYSAFGLAGHIVLRLTQQEDVAAIEFFYLLVLAGLWAIAHNTQVDFCDCTHCLACHDED